MWGPGFACNLRLFHDIFAFGTAIALVKVEECKVIVTEKRYSPVINLFATSGMARILNVLCQVQQAWIFRQSLFFAIPMLFDIRKIAQWRRGLNNSQASHVFPLAQGAGSTADTQPSSTPRSTPCLSSPVLQTGRVRID